MSAQYITIELMNGFYRVMVDDSETGKDFCGWRSALCYAKSIGNKVYYVNGKVFIKQELTSYNYGSGVFVVKAKGIEDGSDDWAELKFYNPYIYNNTPGEANPSPDQQRENRS